METNIKKMYAVIVKRTNNDEQIIAIELDQEKAMATMRNILSMNQNISTNQVYVNEYELKNIQEILDLSI